MKSIWPYPVLKVSESTYLKDPASTDLGRRIVSGSIDQISDLGFEAFTFRKLAKKINSTEASAYRYFESKHQLLLYLVNWYWAWTHYRLMAATAPIAQPQERLRKALHLLSVAIEEDGNFSHINEIQLQQIVIDNAAKTYLTTAVDREQQHGAFSNYILLVAQLAEWVLAVNPDYPYPHMLISNTIEGMHHQRFFAEHLPALTDLNSSHDQINAFYQDLVFKTLAS
ncbi:TetR/AcrR family transcriptional regulator [Persicobacter diffluens]|uniref:TetR family transcriptional regulator n=1 Tax=Persicobacter diffluens TaxID=981 RepID=A0AAN4VXC6_9BACT|nr:TetR family transcriptional regulator [Persicobacter diffluens]